MVVVSMGKQVNKRELSEIMGVTERSLTDWQEEGLPIAHKGERGEENVYDTEIVINWRVQRALARAGKAESQRDREARLRGDMLEIDLQAKNGTMVPAAEVEPIWLGRVRAAAAYMLGRASRLAAILETTAGIEAKREVLRKEDAEFLSHLGVNGAAIQVEVEQLLAKVSETEASAFMKRIAQPA
jgi:phage terminase Nu1 subunit (DNA packaging protein)